MSALPHPAPLLPTYDLDLLRYGRHRHAWRVLGAHADAGGTRFAVVAPHASAAAVVGDFNAWDATRDRLEPCGAGVWAGYVPGAQPGQCYKFALTHAPTTRQALKADPYARAFEMRPRTASVIAPASRHTWRDADWMQLRVRNWRAAPVSIYELHLGSWQRDGNGEFLGYRELARRLLPYVRALGCTHIELLPLTEHPYDASWGYQTVGYFAPTSRHGSADDLRAFVDAAHAQGIGVILDWCPAHFPRDAHGLAEFDGEALYEHPDPRRGAHPDWGTAVFDYARPEVRNLLIASALYWLEEFHFDGLRVDAVASMLYLDYSRRDGDWLPNADGGRENHDAVAFLRELNDAVHASCPGAITIAEESTAWPLVTRPTSSGGLGFDFKWNLGWMHDTLAYLALDPARRRHHHELLTFGQTYAYSENYVLPLSHDEVVHGKSSLLHKSHGDDAARFASLRLLLAWQMTMPGKKLMFMGGEFGSRGEWNHDAALPWDLLAHAPHQGLLRLAGDLNRLYRDLPALHRMDCEPQGFEWLDCHDSAHSVVAFLRRDAETQALAVFNFAPVARVQHRIGVPLPGRWREVLNTDSTHYGGSDGGNAGEVRATSAPWHGRRCSLSVNLPPLSALLLVPDPAATPHRL